MAQQVDSSSGIRPRPRLHRAWWVVLGAFLAIVGAGAFATTAGLLVDPLNAEFGWSRGAIGVAVSVTMVLYGLTAPFAAALMDRFGVRRVVTGVLTSAAIALLAPLADQDEYKPSRRRYPPPSPCS